MLDSRYRDQFQRHIVDPIVGVLKDTSLSANHMTTVSCVSGVSVCLWLALDWRLVALVFLVFSGLADVVDGSLARARQSDGPGGAAYDIFADRCVEASIVAGFFIVDPGSNGPYAFAMLTSILLCITSFLVVGIFAENASFKSFHYSAGLMERTEAFLFFALMICFPSLFKFLAVTFSLLVTYTGVKRMREFQHSVRETTCQDKQPDH